MKRQNGQAEKWALLIGVNQYDDQRIASLRTAAADARLLQKTLIEGLKVPEDNIEILTSESPRKPTRSNISVALQRLAQNVKPGDSVYVLYSGHGVELEGKAYLIPSDAGVLNNLPVVDTLLPTAQFEELLSRINARSVVIAWDMCRNDPLARGRNTISNRNIMTPTQAKAWKTVPADPQKRVTIHLYACSPGQCSYEWQDQGQGYFTYYLDKALRGGAADEKGDVTVAKLVKYLESSVPDRVKRNEQADQAPSARTEGFGVDGFVLAQGFPTQRSLSPAPTVATRTAPTKTNVRTQKIDTRAQLAFKRPIPNTRIVVERRMFTGEVYELDLGPEPTKLIEVYAEAPGYRGTLWKVAVVRGQRAELTLALDPLPSAPPVLPGPPRTVEEVVKQVLERHQYERLRKAKSLVFTAEGLRVRFTADGQAKIEKAEGKEGAPLAQAGEMLLKTLQRLANEDLKVVSRKGRSFRAFWKKDLSVWEVEHDATGFIRAVKRVDSKVTYEWDFNQYTHYGELDLPRVVYYKDYTGPEVKGASYSGRWEVSL
ncbi:MAG: caspase family protein [Armatimonas sp.]